MSSPNNGFSYFFNDLKDEKILENGFTSAEDLRTMSSKYVGFSPKLIKYFQSILLTQLWKKWPKIDSFIKRYFYSVDGFDEKTSTQRTTSMAAIRDNSLRTTIKSIIDFRWIRIETNIR